MFLPALLLLAQAAPAPTTQPPVVTLPGTRTFGTLDEARFNRCHDLAAESPAAGVAEANQWLLEGGTYLALQCLGFAYAKQDLWSAAVATFVRAADQATTARDWRAANLWAQAGNAALAGGDAAAARSHLDTAIVGGQLTGLALGEAYLDRARAAIALDDLPAARTDLDHATRHAAQDPLAWLLSATLARRQDDLVRAQADITVAAQLGTRDAAIALEAGNIAAAAGRLAAARQSWQSAVALGGTGLAAATASRRLAELDAYEAENPAPAPAPAP